MIDWKKQDDTRLEIAGKIADRLADEFNIPFDRMDVIMDLMACNITCPLDFDNLLRAKRGDFIHDLHGINKNLCHDTGKLTRNFLPRYAKRQQVTKASKICAINNK